MFLIPNAKMHNSLCFCRSIGAMATPSVAVLFEAVWGSHRNKKMLCRGCDAVLGPAQRKLSVHAENCPGLQAKGLVPPAQNSMPPSEEAEGAPARKKLQVVRTPPEMQEKVAKQVWPAFFPLPCFLSCHRCAAWWRPPTSHSPSSSMPNSKNCCKCSGQV